MAGSQLRAVLEDKAADVDASSSDFWIMVAALKVWPSLSYFSLVLAPVLFSLFEYFFVHVFIFSDIWFWIVLQQFMANEGQGEPPLDGAIPDMHSFTEWGFLISIIVF